jgi:hypothetical protein
VLLEAHHLIRSAIRATERHDGISSTRLQNLERALSVASHRVREQRRADFADVRHNPAGAPSGHVEEITVREAARCSESASATLVDSPRPSAVACSGCRSRSGTARPLSLTFTAVHDLFEQYANNPDVTADRARPGLQEARQRMEHWFAQEADARTPEQKQADDDAEYAEFFAATGTPMWRYASPNSRAGIARRKAAEG